MNPSTKPDCVAVVGLGLLGRGIAARFLGCGFEVVAVEQSEAQHETARAHIGGMIEELIKHGQVPASLRDEWSARYRPVRGFELLRECSFVVESVTEDLAVKQAVMDAIEAEVGADTVIASNTSAIPITQLQARGKHPGRFVGMHWAGPAHATRFMELIRGGQTTDAAFETAAALARRLGKEPCLCQKDVPGFIVNRIGYAMYREAVHLLQEGVADAATIDTSVRNAMGLWASICGPLRWIDISGGPELYAKAMARVLPTLSNAAETQPAMRDLAASGAHGIANGRGFFNYTPEEAQHWEQLYQQHVWRVAALQDEYFPIESHPHSHAQ
jgi:3-hydroxybutyryl-CoA dehydrogenase